jgi:hypothetical protein
VTVVTAAVSTDTAATQLGQPSPIISVRQMTRIHASSLLIVETDTLGPHSSHPRGPTLIRTLI